MLLVQKWTVFHVFFLGNIGKENVFYYLLERKNDFLGYKKKMFKKQKVEKVEKLTFSQIG